ncbi:MAG TPA: deoxynucleoside kinase [Bacteroidales bacterium]|nr:deoxynucleoside kinase [Bacteroidales bacterium]
MKYNYIAIEGNIGAGKTSLATKIAHDFNGKLILEQFEENAFLPKFYKDPAKYAFPLELAFLAERYNQLKTQLAAQDLFKKFTISDYFINKSLIFARKTLQEDEFILYSKLFTIISASLPRPELLVYLYVDIERLKHNITLRGREYEQNIHPEYLEKIQNSYFEYIRQQQDMRILILDTNKIDFVNNEIHYKNVIDIIDKEYNFGITKIALC